ncbi:Hypothetical protein CAP_8458 [Chondromyces apiculatus DSM 436]|uniref:Uncharacterized protein n=1 Tax=Chondromyces apiculatus DSM 436 TaxID=1192034 RepID=A0A017SWF1_9BACT|nr:Hypothetical protein CAP_8458 [Chondromyces apiculatus DSM 436]
MNVLEHERLQASPCGRGRVPREPLDALRDADHVDVQTFLAPWLDQAR